MKRDNIIEEIKENDLVQLQEIMKEVFESKASYEQIENFYKISNNNKDVYILGYYIKDNLVGTLTLNFFTLPSGKEATIWNLAVKKEYRRLGIARKLMNKAEEIAKSNKGTRTLWLFSGSHRKGAHELYRSLGYDENADKAFVKQID